MKPNPQASHGERIDDFARSREISEGLARVAPDADAAVVAGAIVLFAADVIKDSSDDLLQARSYLEGMRAAIDKLLVNAFPERPTSDTPADGQNAAKSD